VRGDPLPLLPGGAENFSVSAKNFDATMEHTNLDKVEVVYNDNGRIDHNEASKLYRNAKRLFSSVGDTVDAGECYYKEKLHEMKSLASPGAVPGALAVQRSDESAGSPCCAT
jgi:hypothetical protein